MTTTPTIVPSRSFTWKRSDWKNRLIVRRRNPFFPSGSFLLGVTVEAEDILAISRAILLPLHPANLVASENSPNTLRAPT